MPRLSIELQDGFADDTVVIRVDVEEAAREEGARTNLAISRAGSVDVEVPDQPVTVEISVPTQGIEASVTADPGRHRYVLVNARGGRLDAVPSADMPFYM